MDHDFTYNESGYVHDDDCRECARVDARYFGPTKDLTHDFIQDPLEADGFCLCGDVEYVHKPGTANRFARRVIASMDHTLRTLAGLV